MKVESAKWIVCLGLFLITVCCSGQAPEEEMTLTLRHAVDRALSHNLDVKKMEETVAASQAMVTQAQASVLPQVSLKSSYVKLDEQPEMAFNGMSFAMGQRDNYAVTLSASQVVFTGGAVTNAIRQARLGRDATKLGSERVNETMVFNTHILFNNVLLAREQVEVARVALELARTNYHDVESRYDHGMVRKFDLIRAEEMISRYQAALEASKNAVENARITLLNFLDIDPQNPVTLQGNLNYAPWSVEESRALETALAKRQDLHAAELAVQAQLAAVKVARSGFLPQVAVFGEYAEKNPDRTFADDWEDSWQVGVQMSMSLFDGGLSLGKTRQEQAALRRSRIELSQRKDAVCEAVKTSLNNLMTAEAVYRSQTLNVQQATEALRLAQSAYREGLLQQLDLLNAQLSYTRSREQLAQAVFSHRIAVAQVKHSMGIILSETDEERSQIIEIKELENK